jgi:hypothetical protein
MMFPQMALALQWNDYNGPVTPKRENTPTTRKQLAMMATAAKEMNDDIMVAYMATSELLAQTVVGDPMRMMLLESRAALQRLGLKVESMLGYAKDKGADPSRAKFEVLRNAGA